MGIISGYKTGFGDLSPEQVQRMKQEIGRFDVYLVDGDNVWLREYEGGAIAKFIPDVVGREGTKAICFTKDERFSDECVGLVNLIEPHL